MRDFDRIVAAHQALISRIGMQVEVARNAGTEDDVLGAEHEKRWCDQAYFLLLWSQFESAITETVELLIQRGKKRRDWLERRSWDALVPSSGRVADIHFKVQLGLLIDPGRSIGGQSVFSDVLTYYKARNLIAHGGSSSHIPDLVALLRKAHSLFQDSP